MANNFHGFRAREDPVLLQQKTDLVNAIYHCFFVTEKTASLLEWDCQRSLVHEQLSKLLTEVYMHS